MPYFSNPKDQKTGSPSLFVSAPNYFEPDQQTHAVDFQQHKLLPPNPLDHCQYHQPFPETPS
ncbi:unnamed protein product [Pneumocystis jirovecii]|uniref:Uncharacterized protein n=1 Tax=Pneumocystis jirovecii TaxID=42068 RepID=L0PBJ7_PNEJI|nr:unnamed protein product [Pneumocystis jirovecii]